MPFRAVAFLIFVGPAALYYARLRPFGLGCKHIPLDPEASEGECISDTGKFTVALEIEPGQNIPDYRLDLFLPSHVSIDSTDLTVSSLDKERSVLYGASELADTSYTEFLYLETEEAIPPKGESFLIKSQGAGNTRVAITLRPE